THVRGQAAATLLTAEVAEPFGVGRILRGANGQVEAIVEERDATPVQRAIREINVGLYAFDASLLMAALGKLTTSNEQGEEYLTDVVGLLVDAGHPVLAYTAADPSEALGANDRAELATLRAVMRDRVNAGWMRAGVSIIDPRTTWIDVTARVGADT